MKSVVRVPAMKPLPISDKYRFKVLILLPLVSKSSIHLDVVVLDLDIGFGSNRLLNCDSTRLLSLSSILRISLTASELIFQLSQQQVSSFSALLLDSMTNLVMCSSDKIALGVFKYFESI